MLHPQWHNHGRIAQLQGQRKGSIPIMPKNHGAFGVKLGVLPSGLRAPFGHGDGTQPQSASATAALKGCHGRSMSPQSWSLHDLTGGTQEIGGCRGDLGPDGSDFWVDLTPKSFAEI